MKKLISSLCILCAFAFTGLAQDVDPVCPKTITVQHVAGDISPVTVKIVYHVGSINGYCILQQDLGATEPPASLEGNEKSAAASGWFFCNLRPQGYVYNPSNPTLLTPSWNVRFADYVNDPCTNILGEGWIVPTQEAFAAIIKTKSDRDAAWFNATRITHRGKYPSYYVDGKRLCNYDFYRYLTSSLNLGSTLNTKGYVIYNFKSDNGSEKDYINSTDQLDHVRCVKKLNP
jgi:hypothetical protein